MKSFREILEDDMNEAIIVPNLPDIESMEKEDLELQFPDINFYYSDDKKAGGYKNGMVGVNLSKVTKIEDVEIFIFHETIHKIQDSKSQKNIWKIIVDKKSSLEKREIRKLFGITNEFELMAYAGTFALMMIRDTVNVKKYDDYLKQSQFKGVYNIIKKHNKFKKYLYLYFYELNSSINETICLESMTSNAKKEEFKELRNIFSTEIF